MWWEKWIFAAKDKDKVKALGAKWDGNNKSWYINSEDKEKFSEWVK